MKTFIGKHNLLLVFCLFLTAFSAFGQVNTQELNRAIRNGVVTLSNVRGMGASSGAAVTATLRNNTSVPTNINVIIPEGLFLSNSGNSRYQSMIATAVVLSNGGHRESGGTRYISLAPNTNTKVLFVAFCCDMEADEPGTDDPLIPAAVPLEIQGITRKISRNISDNFSNLGDRIKVMQLALWIEQKHSRQAISRVFLFNDEQWEAANRIVRAN